MDFIENTDSKSAKSAKTMKTDASPEVLPYLTADGLLVIPSEAPARYLWWEDTPPYRMDPIEIRAEAEKRMATGKASSGK
jgi:hypothetical protein